MPNPPTRSIQILDRQLVIGEFTDRDLFSICAAMDMACGVQMGRVWMESVNQHIAQYVGGVEIELVHYASRRSAEEDLIFLLKEIIVDFPDEFIAGKRLKLGTADLLAIWGAMVKLAEPLVPQAATPANDKAQQIADLRQQLAQLEAA